MVKPRGELRDQFLARNRHVDRIFRDRAQRRDEIIRAAEVYGGYPRPRQVFDRPLVDGAHENPPQEAVRRLKITSRPCLQQSCEIVGVPLRRKEYGLEFLGRSSLTRTV